jgi:hypothetical protein
MITPLFLVHGNDALCRIRYRHPLSRHFLALLVTVKGWYRIKRPVHYCHFWSIERPDPSSNYSWFIHQSSLVVDVTPISEAGSWREMSVNLAYEVYFSYFAGLFNRTVIHILYLDVNSSYCDRTQECIYKRYAEHRLTVDNAQHNCGVINQPLTHTFKPIIVPTDGLMVKTFKLFLCNSADHQITAQFRMHFRHSDSM